MGYITCLSRLRSLMFEYNTPNYTTVRCENAFCQRGTVVRAECTRSMYLVAKAGEENFSVALKGDLLPVVCC